jgi:HD-GYP domain-containing protein (c-di-GMP phosphodiesterase class II)
VVLDLANGLVEDKSARTAAFARHLAGEAGLSLEDQRDAWFAALLRHLGCTAFASVEATLVTDDVAFRAWLLRGDHPPAVFAALLGANRGHPLLAAGALARAAVSAGTLRTRWASEACEAAYLLAEQLGLGEGVARALDEVFERYDGQGAPRGIGGEALSAVGRVANVAHAAVLAWIDGGVEGADEVLRARGGSVLDPMLAARARASLSGLDALPEAAEPAGPTVDIDVVLTTFGDFADLQTPLRHGHSRAVAALARAAADALGLPSVERRALVRAAHVHDIGEVAVPTSLLGAARPLRAAEWERLRLHPYLTERVLAGADALRDEARIAGAHHERLDGRGYHRASPAHAIPRAARVLAAADAYCALTTARPHRAALARAAAREVLRVGVRDGELDGDCVEAVLAAGGDRRAAPQAGTLTAREAEVLRELALGRTNKEIAVALGISARTVQNHTLNIYGKLGVSTRAGAALRAVQAGLLA